MKLRVRVYQVNAPLYQKINADLKGGQWQGYGLGEATAARGFLAAYQPSKPPINGGFLEKSRFQPEWDGRRWNSVLRLQASGDLPNLQVLTHVYAIG